MADVYNTDSVVTDPESPEAVQAPDLEVPFEETFVVTDEFVTDPESDLAVQLGEFTPHNAFDRLKAGTPEEQFSAAAEADKPKAHKAPAKADKK